MSPVLFGPSTEAGQHDSELRHLEHTVDRMDSGNTRWPLRDSVIVNRLSSNGKYPTSPNLCLPPCAWPFK
jgi:hypothetical protein